MVARTLLIVVLLGSAACSVACARSPGAAGTLSEILELLEESATPVIPPAGISGHRAGSADTSWVTLDRAVELALSGRPAMKAAKDRVLAAEAASRQARAWRNPEAVVEVEGFGGDRPGFEEVEVTVGLAGGLDLFGRAGAGGRVADAALQVERARSSSTGRAVAARARRAFHEVLAYREHSSMAELILQVTRDTRDAIQREVEVGKTANLRGIQIETSLENARLQELEARTRLALAEDRLSSLLAGSHPSSPPLVADGTLRDAFPDLDADSLREELRSRHPDIAAGLWTAESQSRRRQEIGRRRWPELGFQVGYRRNHASDFSDWVGGLSVELPLLDRSQGAVREAERLASAARDETRETELNLIQELEHDLEAGRAAAELLKRFDRDLLPRAREAMRLARLGYEEGKFGYLDLMDAQRSLVLSRAERSRALIAVDGALTDLEVLLGRTLAVPPGGPED